MSEEGRGNENYTVEDYKRVPGLGCIRGSRVRKLR